MLSRRYSDTSEHLGVISEHLGDQGCSWRWCTHHIWHAWHVCRDGPVSLYLHIAKQTLLSAGHKKLKLNLVYDDIFKKLYII